MLFFHGFQYIDLNGDAAKKRQAVGNHLCHLQAGFTEKKGKDQHSRDQEYTLSGSCQKCGRNGASYGLGHHIAHDDPALGGEGDALKTQGCSSKCNYTRVVFKDGYNIRRKNKQHHTDSGEEKTGEFDTEPKTLADPFIEFGTEAESADRLKTLAKADHSGSTKHHDPLYHADGGNGFVAEIAGGMIQTHGSYRGKSLTDQGGKTTLENVIEVYPFEFDALQADGNVAAPSAADVQQAETYKLTDDGGKTGTGNFHVACKDEKRIKTNVQHSAYHNTHHGVRGTALVTQLVIQDQGCHHERGTDEDDTKILRGVMEQFLCRAQQIGQRLQKQLTENADHNAAEERKKESGGCHVAGFFVVLLSKFPGDVVAAALAEEETNGLDHRHHGVDYAHSSGTFRTRKHTYKEGVGHVIKRSD